MPSRTGTSRRRTPPTSIAIHRSAGALPSSPTVAELIGDAQRAHGLDSADGFQVATIDSLVRRPFDPAMPLVLVPRGALETTRAGEHESRQRFDPDVLPGRAAHGASATEMLRALYPADHAVVGLLDTADCRIADLDEESIASGGYVIPALRAEDNVASAHALPWLVARLRAPDGCPWDREQTHQSLRKYLLEEAYEVYDALEDASTPALAGELGDLLLQVVLHAQYAAEGRVFDLTDVYRDVVTKIIRRHPHVFADTEAHSVAQVIRNWERIKAAERDERAAATEATVAGGEANGAVASSESAHGAIPAAFRGLSRSLPALAYSQEIQERAASLGYDWPAIEPVLAKLEEELAELHEAASDQRRAEELGDVLLVIVNLGRKLGIDAEAALRAANARFARRFAAVERLAAARDQRLSELSFEQLDELWDQAKIEIAAAGGRPEEETPRPIGDRP